MLPSGHEQVDCHDPLAFVVTIYNRQSVKEKSDHAVMVSHEFSSWKVVFAGVRYRDFGEEISSLLLPDSIHELLCVRPVPVEPSALPAPEKGKPGPVVGSILRPRYLDHRHYKYSEYCTCPCSLLW
jgi:hypothetical protein